MAEFEDIPDDPPVEDRPIFHDEEGQSVKFHLQQDLSEYLIANLKDLIETHGGTIIETVPRKGYLLVDPTSEKGDRMIHKWTDPARPERHVVCYTFVLVSVYKKAIVSDNKMDGVQPIFMHEGDPVAIYADRALGPMRVKDLTYKILLYGGFPAVDGPSSRVVVSDDSKPGYKVLQQKYDNRLNKFVEPLSWMKECINHHRYGHRPLVTAAVKRPPGRKAGGARNEYSVSDDAHLVEYLSRRLPNASVGGRAGNKVYKDLCEEFDTYPWSTRHPWESWRNRYVKDKARFDAAISRWVAENGGRKMEQTRTPNRRRRTEDDDEEVPSPEPSQPPSKRSRASASASPTKKRGFSEANDDAPSGPSPRKKARHSTEPAQYQLDENLTAEQLLRFHLGLASAVPSGPSPRKSGSTGMASSTVRHSEASKKSSDATFVSLSGDMEDAEVNGHGDEAPKVVLERESINPISEGHTSDHSEEDDKATEALLGLGLAPDVPSAAEDIAEQQPKKKGKAAPASASKGKGKAKAVSPIDDHATDDELMEDTQGSFDPFTPGFETQQFVAPRKVSARDRRPVHR